MSSRSRNTRSWPRPRSRSLSDWKAAGAGELSLAASAGTTPTTPTPDATNSDVRATLLNDAVFRRPFTFSIINPPGVRTRPVRVPTVGRTDATTLWAGLPAWTPQRRGEATPEWRRAAAPNQLSRDRPERAKVDRCSPGF